MSNFTEKLNKFFLAHAFQWGVLVIIVIFLCITILIYSIIQLRNQLKKLRNSKLELTIILHSTPDLWCMWWRSKKN
jgi:hypothetical protein